VPPYAHPTRATSHAIKRILWYLRGTIVFSLLFRRSTTNDLVVYIDADWAFAVFLGDSLVSWSSKRRVVISRSSAKVEYHAVANGVAEAAWLRQLL
jgi:hypothetical protein